MSPAIFLTRWARLLAALLVLALLIGSAAAPLPAQAESDCSAAAKTLYGELIGEGHELLERRIEAQCSFAAGWIDKEAFSTSQAAKTMVCRDLVLVWTHQECIYQRDYIDPAVYEPCKAWSREMFERCSRSDVGWFGRQEPR